MTKIRNFFALVFSQAHLEEFADSTEYLSLSNFGLVISTGTSHLFSIQTKPISVLLFAVLFFFFFSRLLGAAGGIGIILSKVITTKKILYESVIHQTNDSHSSTFNMCSQDKISNSAFDISAQ
jgi:type III secretory pathway component EscT